jgi:hypothetical protein
MANILVLYLDEDSPMVEEFSSALEAHGHSLVELGLFSLAEIDYPNAVPHYISSCDVAMPVITSACVTSRRFRKELAFIFGYMGDQKRLDAIVPVIMDGTSIDGEVNLFSPIVLDPAKISTAVEDVLERVDKAMGKLAAQAAILEEKRENVKRSAATYIENTQKALKDREKDFKLRAEAWYVVSYVSLGGGVGLGIWKGAGISVAQDGLPLAAYLFAGLIATVFLVAISKLSFTLAKGYMVESLRNADRSHAIAFGEFYLNAFEEKIEWSEVKDVFQHWNIDRGSSFISQEASQFDPNLLETALEIAKVLKAQEKA